MEADAAEVRWITELWVAGGVGCVELRTNDVQPPAAAVVRAVALY